jgi:hypothetical protein
MPLLQTNGGLVPGRVPELRVTGLATRGRHRLPSEIPPGHPNTYLLHHPYHHYPTTPLYRDLGTPIFADCTHLRDTCLFFRHAPYTPATAALDTRLPTPLATHTDCSCAHNVCRARSRGAGLQA